MRSVLFQDLEGVRMPEISIIVPVYNVEPYIRRCVDSILAQTFTDFELILVDDGSPDNCGTICDEYAAGDSRIRVFHQENQGQAAARNHALDWIFEHSDSEYISFIDSDDWVHPRYLELLLQGIQRYSVNICQCAHLDTDGTDEAPAVVGCFSSVTAEEQYVNHYSSFMWDKLFARSCWENMRFPEGQIYEDVAIWYKLLFKEEQVVLVEDVLYYYFVNPQSTVHKDWTPAKLAQIDAWENQLQFAKHHGCMPVLQTALKRFCWVYKHQCEEIAGSNKISEAEKKLYSAKLMRRLRVVLLQNRKELQEIGIFNRYFVWAIPKLNKIYWTLRGVWGKLKRLFTR